MATRVTIAENPNLAQVLGQFSKSQEKVTYAMLVQFSQSLTSTINKAYTLKTMNKEQFMSVMRDITAKVPNIRGSAVRLFEKMKDMVTSAGTKQIDSIETQVQWLLDELKNLEYIPSVEAKMI